MNLFFRLIISIIKLFKDFNLVEFDQKFKL